MGQVIHVNFRPTPFPTVKGLRVPSRRRLSADTEARVLTVTRRAA